MEASVLEQEVPAAVESHAENTEQIFRWNTWVHVGPGAETCEHATDGKCERESAETPLAERHFHAWCRLPNQFAYRDITEKAQAARARKQRQLRDPQSDANAILEDQLDALKEMPDAMVQEIVYSKWGDDEDARLQVAEDEKYQHIDEDRIELVRLEDTPADQRDEDAYVTLRRHVEEFDDAVEKALVTIRTRREESLRALPVDELVSQIRKVRIDRIGLQEYLHVSNYWVWFVGAMSAQEGSGTRKFTSITNLTSAPGEVLAALQIAFTELENHLAPSGSAKNS